MELESLQDLYVHELRDLYSAEKQIIKALPKMAKGAANPKLKEGFQKHLEQTKIHVERLETVLGKLGKSTRGDKCKGMEGLLIEGEKMLEEDATPEVKDAGLISSAQRVEHYEIAGYGCAKTYAKALGDKEGEQLLNTTLQEEGATDKELTKLAVSTVNVKAQK